MSRPLIELVEVSARDGLQNEPTPISSSDKVELVLRAVSAGARRVEAVSFVSPRAVPQMADAEAVMAELRAAHDLRARGVKIAGLVLNRRGLERALAADVDEVNFVVSASESFNVRNQGAPIAQTLAQLKQTVAVCRIETMPISVTLGTAFGCPFEGEVSLEQVTRLVEAAVALGVDEIALADTIGVADPLTVERWISAVRTISSSVPVRCHFHDTRNTGIANAFAAWRAGAAALDTSLGGVGGCPFAPGATGNVATEDAVYMFNRMGVETGFSLAALAESSAWLGAILGKAVPAALARSGDFPRRAARVEPQDDRDIASR